MVRLKLSAASLIEVTVAMVIILLVWTIALTIFINVTTSGGALKKVRYQVLLKEYALKVKNEKLFIDDEFNINELTVHRKVAPYMGNNSLLYLHLTITDVSGKVVCQYQELIYRHEKN
jgi:hypothetical protein